MPHDKHIQRNTWGLERGQRRFLQKMIKNDLCARPKTQISTCFSVLIDRQILLSMPAIVIIFSAFFTPLTKESAIIPQEDGLRGSVREFIMLSIR